MLPKSSGTIIDDGVQELESSGSRMLKEGTEDDREAIRRSTNRR